jgi:hypothetical protein
VTEIKCNLNGIYSDQYRSITMHDEYYAIVIGSGLDGLTGVTLFASTDALDNL